MLFNCQTSHDKTTENQISKKRIVQDVVKPDNFKTVQLKLDTTTSIQNMYFEIDDSLFFGLKEYLIEATLSDDLGYIVFAKDNGLNVALIKYENKRHKVIGVTRIPSLKGKEEFIQELYPERISKFITFGVVEANEGKVKTIRAWRINNKNKSIEQINPSTIDFTDSYDADTD